MARGISPLEVGRSPRQAQFLHGGLPGTGGMGDILSSGKVNAGESTTIRECDTIRYSNVGTSNVQCVIKVRKCCESRMSRGISLSQYGR